MKWRCGKCGLVSHPVAAQLESCDVTAMDLFQMGGITFAELEKVRREHEA